MAISRSGPAYDFSIGSRPGVVASNNFLSLFNPVGSEKNLSLSGVFISASANAASATTTPMRGNRITSATGGTLRGDIAKFVTADPDPVAEVRIDNPTVTRTEQILNAPPPTSTGAYSSGAVNQITIPPGAGGFILAPGEGIALNTAAGDTAQQWNISVVWVEQTL